LEYDFIEMSKNNRTRVHWFNSSDDSAPYRRKHKRHNEQSRRRCYAEGDVHLFLPVFSIDIQSNEMK